MQEIKDSMAVTNTTFDDRMKKCEQMLDENVELKKQNQTLQSYNFELVEGLTQLEQYSRPNNVDIKELAIVENEHCLEIVKTISIKAFLDVAHADIDTGRRVPISESVTLKSVIVRFVTS